MKKRVNLSFGDPKKHDYQTTPTERAEKLRKLARIFLLSEETQSFILEKEDRA